MKSGRLLARAIRVEVRTLNFLKPVRRPRRLFEHARAPVLAKKAFGWIQRLERPGYPKAGVDSAVITVARPGSGRIWYCPQDGERVVHITRASTGHPKETD
jgi:hypothetical protein